MKQKTRKPKTQDDAPATPQNMSYMFKCHAEALTRKWNEFSHKPKDPELAICHGTYEQAVSTSSDLTKQYLGIDLPELPELPGNDYLAGINHLARYCKDAARMLTEKPNDSEDDIYISSAVALRFAKSNNRKISPTKLSIGLKDGKLKLKNGNSVRSKQQLSNNGKPYRRTVHFGDFKELIKNLPKIKPDGKDITDESIDELTDVKDYVDGTIATTDLIRKEKEAKYKKSNPKNDQGYTRLARKIYDPDS